MSVAPFVGGDLDVNLVAGRPVLAHQPLRLIERDRESAAAQAGIERDPPGALVLVVYGRRVANRRGMATRVDDLEQVGHVGPPSRDTLLYTTTECECKSRDAFVTGG